MVKFYLGYSWSKKIREVSGYPFAFLSAGTCWSYTNRKKLAIFKLPNAEEIMLDSGGFSFFNRYADYPFDITTYIDWIIKTNENNKNKVVYVAIRDYPCEPEINRSNLMTNEERIKKTIDNAEECMDFDELEINCNWLPVLQGYTKEEYLECLDLYKKRGLLTNYIAIGSMCRRTDIKQIESILKSIRKEYSGKIHLFGLTLNALKSKYIADNIFSCDSIGYTFNCKTQEEVLIKSNIMISKFWKKNNFHKKQTQLETGGQTKPSG